MIERESYRERGDRNTERDKYIQTHINKEGGALLVRRVRVASATQRVALAARKHRMGNGVLHLTGHPLKCGNSSALQHVFVHTSIEPTWLHMNRIYIMAAAAALYWLLNGSSSSSSTGASCRNQHSKLQTRHAQLDTRHA